jgi:chromosomal replication initiator protein
LDEVAGHGGLAVVTLREQPGESRELLPALRSRLVGGLLVPIAMPGLAARRAMLTDWAELLGVSLADEAADVLAAGLELAPPLLRGAIVTLVCAANGRAIIDVPAARTYVADRGTTGQVSLQAVAAKTARYFGLTLADLKSGTRRRNLVEARAVAMYLSRRLTGLSLERIGAFFGDRDHTTVLHNCRRTENLQTTDAATRHAVSALEDILKRTARSPSRRRKRRTPAHGIVGGNRVASLTLSGV